MLHMSSPFLGGWDLNDDWNLPDISVSHTLLRSSFCSTNMGDKVCQLPGVKHRRTPGVGEYDPCSNFQC